MTRPSGTISRVLSGLASQVPRLPDEVTELARKVETPQLDFAGLSSDSVAAAKALTRAKPVPKTLDAGARQVADSTHDVKGLIRAHNRNLFRGLVDTEQAPINAAERRIVEQGGVLLPGPVTVPQMGQSTRTFMTETTPREIGHAVWGPQMDEVIGRQVDRNPAEWPGAPFPSVVSGGHDRPIHVLTSTNNSFPGGGADGVFTPGMDLVAVNRRTASPETMAHEGYSHAWTAGKNQLDDHVTTDPGFHRRLLRKVGSNTGAGDMPRHLMWLDGVDPDSPQAHLYFESDDAINHRFNANDRASDDWKEFTAMLHDLKREASNITGKGTATRAQDDDLWNWLFGQGYRKYGVQQPRYEHGPLKGRRVEGFNGRQRGMKSVIESLSPEDQDIVRELWFRFGDNKGVLDGLV